MGREVADAVEAENRNNPTGEERAKDLRVVVRVCESSWRAEARLVAQDLGLKLLQLRAGLDAQLLDEAGASVLVDIECLRLPPGAVEGEHELSAERLAEQVLRTAPSISPEASLCHSRSGSGLDPLFFRDGPDHSSGLRISACAESSNTTRPAPAPRQAGRRSRSSRRSSGPTRHASRRQWARSAAHRPTSRDTRRTYPESRSSSTSAPSSPGRIEIVLTRKSSPSSARLGPRAIDQRSVRRPRAAHFEQRRGERRRCF